MTATQLPRSCRPALPLPDLTSWAGLLLPLPALLYLPHGRFTYPTPPVQAPFSSSISCLRENHSVTISIDAQSRVYLEADTYELQTALIQQVAQNHSIALNARQVQELRKMPFLSQNIEQLPAWLSASPTQRRRLPIGISTAEGHDQLSEYLAAVSGTSRRLYGKKPYYFIRADQRLAAAQIKFIIKRLQKQGINRFNLVTNLEPGW